MNKGVAVTCLSCTRLMRPSTNRKGEKMHLDKTFNVLYETFECPQCANKVNVRRELELTFGKEQTEAIK
jgi:transcription elongation factor Elf1